MNKRKITIIILLSLFGLILASGCIKSPAQQAPVQQIPTPANSPVLSKNVLTTIFNDPALLYESVINLIKGL